VGDLVLQLHVALVPPHRRQLVAAQFGFAAVVDIGVGDPVPQACMGWIAALL
jgi:hypothetical protein